MMAISYSENNKRKTIFEPLLNRQRLIYKGPVSSSIINLANDQFLMDVHRLDEKTELLENLISESGQMSRNDMNLATPDSYLNEDMLMTIYSQYIYWDESAEDYVVESATPYYESVLEYNKPQLNSAMISQMRRKLNLIEDALKTDD
jgi:hypothetical protein